MGWLILSGKENSLGYDSDLQLVRHNGTTGEVGVFPYSNISESISFDSRLTKAGSYVFVNCGRNTALSSNIIYRGTFDSWPPTFELCTFSKGGSAVPYTIDGFVKYGSVYYGVGCTFSGNTPTYYLVANSSTTTFYSQYVFYGNYITKKIIVKGENDRYIFFKSSSSNNPAVTYTDDFITFSESSTIVSGGFIYSAAGNSSGVWVFCIGNSLGSSTTNVVYVSTDNLSTFSYLNSLVFNRVWAFGTTLYGAANGRVYSSTDGTTWTDKGLPFGNVNLDVYSIVYDGSSTYLIVGEMGYAVTTTNFSTYTTLPGYDFLGHTLFDAVYLDNSTLYPSTGTGTISGTLRLDSASGSFAARTVYLYNYTTGAKVAETTSNGTTGAWSFTGLAAGDYFVVGVATESDVETNHRDFDAMGVITVT